MPRFYNSFIDSRCLISKKCHRHLLLPQPLQLEPLKRVPALCAPHTAAISELHYCSITEINYAENSHFPHFCHRKAWGVTCQTDERNTGVLRHCKTRTCARHCQSCPHIVGYTQILCSTSQLCRPESKKWKEQSVELARLFKATCFLLLESLYYPWTPLKMRCYALLLQVNMISWWPNAILLTSFWQLSTVVL